MRHLANSDYNRGETMIMLVKVIRCINLATVLLLAMPVAAQRQEQVAQTTATQEGTSFTLTYVDRWLPESVQRDRKATATVDMIMLHFCSDCIANPDNPYNVDRIVEIFTSYTVSAHYLIGRDGVVYRFVPESKVAFHAGRGKLEWMPDRANQLNEYAIGIEMLNVGTWKDMQIFMSKEKYDAFAEKHPDWIGYTDAQFAALDALISDIRKRHPAIWFDRKHIVGHSEYAGVGRRTDPGELLDYARVGLPKTQ
ncbi:MAG: N-acetylmuramoyl-L-alanine amidase [Candidatus Sumerlaeaceae bacterium]